MTGSEWPLLLRAVTLPDGDRLLVLDTPIPDDVPEEIKEGLARRSIVASGGRCPCGARVTWPNREQRRRAVKAKEPMSVQVEHEDGCPAITTDLKARIRAWRGAGA